MDKESLIRHFLYEPGGLFDFAKDILGFELLSEEHRSLCRFLEDFSQRKAIVMTPRDTLKTTISSIAYPIWRALRASGQISILLYSRTMAQAQLRVESIRARVKTPEFISLFGNIEGEVWSREQLDFSFRGNYSAKEKTITAAGLDSETTGTHYQLVISDDTSTELNTNTPEQVNFVISRLKALDPLLSERGEDHKSVGQLIFVNTPYTEKDAVAWAKETYKDAKIFHASAYTPIEKDILNEEMEDFYASGAKLHYPVCLPFERLKKSRAEMGHLFYSQYLCVPVAGAERAFDVKKIQYVSRDMLPKNLRVYTAVDPSGVADLGKFKSDSDYTAIVTIGIDAAQNFYVLAWNMYRGDDVILRSAEMIIEHHMRWKSVVIGIEKVGLGSLAVNVRDAFREKGLYAVIADLQPKGRTKVMRVLALAPILQRNKFFIGDWLQNSAEHIEFMNELNYTTISGIKSKHDDLCFAEGTLIATPNGNKPIETLKAGDRVLTPIGAREVIAAGQTGVKRCVTKQGLTATEGHKIATKNNGWLQLQDVCDSIHVWKLSFLKMWSTELVLMAPLFQRPCSSTEQSTALWDARENRNTISRVLRQTPREKAREVYMSIFGGGTTKEKSARALKFIIWTATLSITTLKTWAAFRLGNIAATMRTTRRTRSLSGEKITWLKFVRLPWHGTDPKRAARGILTTVKTRLEKFTNISVKFAELFLKRLKSPVNFVLAHAAYSPAGFLADGLLKLNAIFADRFSRPININTATSKNSDINHSAPESAPPVPVFNLTVEQAGCYYANGILVSNCDAMAYACSDMVRDFGTPEPQSAEEMKAAENVDLSRLDPMSRGYWDSFRERLSPTRTGGGVGAMLSS